MTVEPATDFLRALSVHLRSADRSGPAADELLKSAMLLSVREKHLTSAEAPNAHHSLPVCTFWDDARTAAGRDVPALAGPLARLADRLVWMQNPNYRRSPPSPTFLDNYGFAAIVDRPGGAPSLAYDDRVAVGLLMLGPKTE
ncbi:hypothetical protein JOD67_006926 [Tenggerimyces flavus]|nr:hypothetical protein [Tenggerimyces flavus]